jgi:UbiA prenyltransferase family
MAVETFNAISIGTLLRLGRVSNLPTVWTNVLAGTVLAGATPHNFYYGLVLVAMSLFYLGGMYLNDYFDSAIDACERPERPIPAGEIHASTVAAIGFALLAVGILTLAPTGLFASAIGFLLSAVIVGYNYHHKNSTIAPVVMGVCRALVYFTAAAAAVGQIPIAVIIAGGALLAYIAGVTYAARQESLDRVAMLWPLAVLSIPLLVALPNVLHDLVATLIFMVALGWIASAVYVLVRRPMPGAVSLAVGWLIAGISLIDAAFLAGVDAIEFAILAILGSAATLAFQRYVAGT